MRVLYVALVVLSCLWVGCSEDECICPVEAPFHCPDEGVIVMTVGQADDFAPPFEAVFPDSNLTRLIATGWSVPLRYLDDLGLSESMGHTFVWPKINISEATLEIHLRALGDISENDRLSFELNDKYFEGENEVYRWTTTIAILTQTNWAGGEDTTLVLDLGHLPVDLYGRTSVLSYMQDGNLDVEVQDDTAVDYMVLRLSCSAGDARTTGELVEAPIRK